MGFQVKDLQISHGTVGLQFLQVYIRSVGVAVLVVLVRGRMISK